MAEPESQVQPSLLSIDYFDNAGPVELDLPCGPIDLGPASSSQFFLDLGVDAEQFGPPMQNSNSTYAWPDGMHDMTLPFPVATTCFSNPLDEHIAALDIEMDLNRANDCGTQSVPTSFLRTEQSDAQKMKGPPNTSGNTLVDSNAVQLCEFWLHLYPKVYPNDADIRALSQLTGQLPASIEQWLNSKIRSVPSFFSDSGIGSSSSSTVSCVTSSETAASRGNCYGTKLVLPQITKGPSEAALTEMFLPQTLQRNPNDGESSQAPVSTPVDGRARLMVEIPVTWTTSPLVSDSLVKAAWSSRARISCHPTSDIARLERNPDKPLQCTRKCGYATGAKKDWKRHESNAFPQHGFLCTVPAAVRIGNVTFCAYCPTDRRQPNPTIDHMKSEHSLTFLSERDMEMSICNQVCHRKEHMKIHFNKIHPGIHPDAWVSVGAFDVKHSAFPKQCGFCGKAFTSWNERINHIEIHFERDGFDMRQWKDFDNSDHHRNKRHRRDDDTDDGSDCGDSDEDNDDDFGKGNSGAGKRGNRKNRNTRARQSDSDRSLQNRLHSRGTSSSDRDSASEDEQMSVPKHIYNWLNDVSPDDTSSVQEALCDRFHWPKSHLDDSDQDTASPHQAKDKQDEHVFRSPGTPTSAVTFHWPKSHLDDSDQDTASPHQAKDKQDEHVFRSPGTPTSAVTFPSVSSCPTSTTRILASYFQTPVLAFTLFDTPIHQLSSTDFLPASPLERDADGNPTISTPACAFDSLDLCFTVKRISDWHSPRLADFRTKPPPTPRAMDWVIDHKGFKRRTEGSRELLWIKGLPGAGKMCIDKAFFAKMGGDKIPATLPFFRRTNNRLPILNRDGNRRPLVDASNLRAASCYFRKTLQNRSLRTWCQQFVADARTGDTIIVCDAGGGTVDVASYSLTHRDKLGAEETVGASRDGFRSSHDVIVADIIIMGCGISSNPPLPSELDRLTDEP